MGEAKSSSNARDEKGKFNAWVHNRNAAGHHHALDTIAPIERRQYENTIIPFGSIVILFLMTHNVRINVVRPQLGEAYANCKSYSKKSKQTKMYIDASLTTTVDSTHHFPICSSNKISGSPFVRCCVCCEHQLRNVCLDFPFSLCPKPKCTHHTPKLIDEYSSINMYIIYFWYSVAFSQPSSLIRSGCTFTFCCALADSRLSLIINACTWNG